jgi:hypothetical protein
MHDHYADKLVNTVCRNNAEIIYVYTENHSEQMHSVGRMRSF